MDQTRGELISFFCFSRAAVNRARSVSVPSIPLARGDEEIESTVSMFELAQVGARNLNCAGGLAPSSPYLGDLARHFLL